MKKLQYAAQEKYIPVYNFNVVHIVVCNFNVVQQKERTVLLQAAGSVRNIIRMP